MGVVGADRAGKAGTHPGQVISAIIPAQGRVLVVLTFCGGGRGGYRWGGRGILLGLTSVGWAGCSNELLADRLRIFFARSLMLGDGHAARGEASSHAGSAPGGHPVDPCRDTREHRACLTRCNLFGDEDARRSTLSLSVVTPMRRGWRMMRGTRQGGAGRRWGSFPIASPALLPHVNSNNDTGGSTISAPEH
jgi:hypothetical protein